LVDDTLLVLIGGECAPNVNNVADPHGLREVADVDARVVGCIGGVDEMLCWNVFHNIIGTNTVWRCQSLIDVNYIAPQHISPYPFRIHVYGNDGAGAD
ncbi:hypothetical protein, partial [Mycobacterium montefiorense]|uniref:hypothetical protein n=1 Tax=Mycobacterium montefiorense TaxID=154654 RepID=UPI00222E5275